MILTPRVGVYSESFIKNHILHLAKAVGTWEIVKNIDFDKHKILVIDDERFLSVYPKELKSKIIKFVKDNNITHILIEFGRCFSQFLELNLSELRLPTFIHFHGWDASKVLTDERTVYYYRWLSKYTNKFIVVSEKMRRDIHHIGIPKEKTILNYYGVNVNNIIIKNYSKINENKCTFIFVGRFVPKKSPLNLLRAFHIALQHIRNDISIELKMIGNTPKDFVGTNLFNVCKEYVKNHSLDKYVKFLGVLDHYNVLKELSNSDVYVQHSITCPQTGDSEGLPNSILEASLSGLPVISTYHAGIPEAIIDGINGFLVKENDIELMAKYMVKLAENPLLRKKFGLRSIELNKDRFSLTNSISKLKNYIEKENFNLSKQDITEALKEYNKLRNLK
jgi:glycosyltransferase involved in cell wall biosynthesis